LGVKFLHNTKPSLFGELKNRIAFNLCFYNIFKIKNIVIVYYSFKFFKGLIKFLVPINIHNFVFSPYKIKSHFLVPVTFSLSILGTKNVDGIFL